MFELCTEFHSNTDQRIQVVNSALFLQWGAGANDSGPTLRNVWHNKDLKPLGVSPDAKAALLSGLLIITHGTNNQIADLTITFRKPDDWNASPYNRHGQVVEAHIGGGQRSTYTVTVPLLNGTFDYAFSYNDPIGWPYWSAYAVNLQLLGWWK